jgi:hypothetical protein
VSNHRTIEEAVDRIRARLEELDPDHSVAWAEVERRAVQHAPRAGLTENYEAAEGPKLERIVAALREATPGQ